MFSASCNLALTVLAVVQVGWPLAQEQDRDSGSSTRSRPSVRVRDSASMLTLINLNLLHRLELEKKKLSTK